MLTLYVIFLFFFFNFFLLFSQYILCVFLCAFCPPSKEGEVKRLILASFYSRVNLRHIRTQNVPLIL